MVLGFFLTGIQKRWKQMNKVEFWPVAKGPWKWGTDQAKCRKHECSSVDTSKATSWLVDGFAQPMMGRSPNPLISKSSCGFNPRWCGKASGKRSAGDGWNPMCGQAWRILYGISPQIPHFWTGSYLIMGWDRKPHSRESDLWKDTSVYLTIPHSSTVFCIPPGGSGGQCD